MILKIYDHTEDRLISWDNVDQCEWNSLSEAYEATSVQEVENQIQHVLNKFKNQCSIFQEYLEHRNDQEFFDLLASNPVSGTYNFHYLHFNKNGDWYLILFDGNGYICNDSGKTIDRVGKK